MSKRISAILLTFLMLSTLFSIPVSAVGTGNLNNFQKSNIYNQGQYIDVPETNAFAANVKTAFEYGIMQGYGNSFGITNNITRMASIIIACRIHAIYTSGQNDIESQYSGTLQEKYLAYAQSNGIYCTFPATDKPATRAEFAKILSSALPDEALATINSIDDGAIPDISISDTFSDAIYRLYRSGVIIGSDSKGTFYPTQAITRGAACAIATRMVFPSLRKTITLTKGTGAVNAESIYTQCSTAVAYIEVADYNNNVYASGSGFFISSDGTFATCYHVIDGCASATITTKDGKKYSVAGVYDYSKDYDWAILKVNGSNFPYLLCGNETEYTSGSTVYAIGSPLGLSDSISEGIISNPSREYDGMSYIQTTASISSGSSGGALISKSGHVIGITAASFADGQSLNLAIPVSYISRYKKNSVTSFSALFPAIASSTKPTTTNSSRRYDIYNYLCWILAENSNSNVSGENTFVYDTGADELILRYDTQSNGICITDIFTADSGVTVYATLFVDANLEPYFYNYQVYKNPYVTYYESMGSSTIYPQYFNPDKEMTFSSYDGYGLSSDQEIASLMLGTLLINLNSVFTEYFSDGFTINDLGFSYMYSLIS